MESLIQDNSVGLPRDQITASLKQILEKKVLFALVFGSLVTSAFSDESDIDIAVYLPKEATNEDRNELRGELLKQIPRDVDLIFLNDSDLIITMQVLANGQLIVNRSPTEFTRFKARKISEYIDFKISRRMLEETLVRGMKHA